MLRVRLGPCVARAAAMLALALAACRSPTALSVEAVSTLAAADVAPPLQATDHRGRVVSLDHATDATPVVLVFYRGHW